MKLDHTLTWKPLSEQFGKKCRTMLKRDKLNFQGLRKVILVLILCLALLVEEIFNSEEILEIE